MDAPEGLREFLLAFADDEHLMGQQHTEWIGVAPFLEEDLAFSSIGQDELGHAALLYELVLELDGVELTDTAIDTLAFGRPNRHYRCCHLVEYTTQDWAEALVRHWVYDTFEAARWERVSDSSLPKLAAIARKALREEAFHRRHADALLDKLLASPEARTRILAALEAIAPLVPGLCEPVAGEAEAVGEGVAAGPTAELLEPLLEDIGMRFSCSTVSGLSASGTAVGGLPASGSAGGSAAGGPPAASTANGQVGRTRRSVWFEPLMARMREVLAYDPEAVW